MSVIDWSRATITVRVPVMHTATETWEDIEVPWAYLVSDEGLRAAQRARLASEVSKRHGIIIEPEDAGPLLKILENRS